LTNNSRLKKPNLNFFPASLLKESHRVLGDEFSNLNNRIQTGYVNVFWNHYGIIKRNKHKSSPDSFYMNAKEVKKLFTDRQNFRAVNDNGYYLKPSGTKKYGYSFLARKKEGFTFYKPTEWVINTIYAATGVRSNGFKLAPKINQLMKDWYAQSDDETNKELGFVNSKGESIVDVVNDNGGAIFRDKSNIDHQINVNLNVQLDVHTLTKHKQQLQQLLQYLKDNNIKQVVKDTNEWDIVKDILLINTINNNDKKLRGNCQGTLGVVKLTTPLQSLMCKDIKIDGVEQRIIEINRLLVSVRESGSASVPVIYEENSTGRYQTQGAVLQGYHKSVRYAALSGCYEYDLEAAHQNILLQLLEQKDVDFPELAKMREYVANKHKIRIQLSDELNTDINTVKEILQLLTYGGTLSRSNKCSLYETCDGNMPLLNRVVSNPWLKQYRSMFDLAYTHLTDGSEQITNAVGIDKLPENKRQAMAHILQGCERQVLDAVIKHSNRNDIALLIHDCVVFYNQQSPEELSRIVREETGFNLEFSEDKYTD